MIVTVIDPDGYPIGNRTEDRIMSTDVTVTPAYQWQFVKGRWNGTEWVEAATAEELDDLNQRIALAEETQRYIKRSNDGRDAYAKISAEFRLAKLRGAITEESHAFIEKTLIPVRNEVLAGQWKSGLKELEIIGSATIGIELYNRLHLQITNYTNENY